MDLVQLLRDADRILIFTGAGVSTGSGIRDFRGPKGVWRERQPVYFQDFMNSEAARIEYWDQKCQAWPSFRDAEPNAVHTSIADLERAGKLTMVITQNIDGLHSRGGTSAERLVELHGHERGHRMHELPCAQRSRLSHEELFRKREAANVRMRRIP